MDNIKLDFTTLYPCTPVDRPFPMSKFERGLIAKFFFHIKSNQSLQKALTTVNNHVYRQYFAAFLRSKVKTIPILPIIKYTDFDGDCKYSYPQQLWPTGRGMTISKISDIVSCIKNDDQPKIIYSQYQPSGKEAICERLGIKMIKIPYSNFITTALELPTNN